MARAPSPYDVPSSPILPPGFEATSVATSRCTSGIEYAPAVKSSGDVDLDHVRRARQVDRGACRRDDAVAGLDHAGVERRLDRPCPEILDIVGLRHQDRRDPPLQCELLHGGLVVGEADN